MVVAIGWRGLLEDVTPVSAPWLTLLVAVLGLIGTAGGAIAGVLITQRRSDRREERNWQRERERERERWAREDIARTFEQRREAYSDFYESLREMTALVYEHRPESEEQEMPPQWYIPTYRKLQRLELYASGEVSRLAVTAYGMCRQWGNTTGLGQANAGFYELQQRTDEHMWRLLIALRADLGVDTPEMMTSNYPRRL